MHRMLSMWLGLAAVTAAMSLGGPLTGLNDQLTAESEADAKAADDVKCWCKSVQSALDDRLRNSDSQISELEGIRDQRFYENQGLNIEVKQNQKAIADNSQSIEEANAIALRSKKGHLAEQEETKQALKSVRKAKEIVKKGDEVHGVLTGLEDSFASKLKASQEAHKTRQAQFQNMNGAKGEMLRLAREGEEMKMRRLADGMAVIAQAKSDIVAYTGQREADYALQSSLKSVCGDLADAATNRLKQRQDTLIAISEDKAKNAQNVAMKAMSKISKVLLLKSKSGSKASSALVLQALGGAFKGDCEGVKDRAEDTKRRADQNLAGARKAAAAIMALMDKSNGIQKGMTNELSNVVMSSHLSVSKGKLSAAIKGKVETLGSTAGADLKATRTLFDEVRAKAKESTRADMKVVTSLQMGAAMAGTAKVEAGKCK